ncbi:MAG: precorrin-6y C5,15-methyltransferase (decarboxylating) subunit CbiE [Nitrosopumilus sp. H8]|nr:MAG: precorrin-6y C5,15-methyltransferase (decarboxylating) subunit CbiE [Nitrosopumilus sp. H13]RNJ79852.1 MAG: precorrin-6y C5,15-methyltransferase (decarboxylating) subunit CbiE [Nitrosopumilus sp. H8]
MGKVYAVGVGPGSPDYVTKVVGEIIRGCDIVIGYRYTLDTIRHLVDGKDVREITMNSQEDAYQKALAELGEKVLVVPFTGDVNFSESEVVDRLVEIFGSVEIVPGISAVQVAASRAGVPLDKSRIITMHVTGTIEGKKTELQRALADGLSVILVPRPWPSRPERHFMPSEIAAYLRERGFATDKLRVHVFEALTTDAETRFTGTVKELEGREFSDLSVMVFDQAVPDSYINYQQQ